MMKYKMNKNNILRCLIAAVLIVFAICLVGCGSSGKDHPSSDRDNAENGGISSGGPTTSDKLENNEDAYERKVIRDATVNAETRNYTDALDALQSTVKKMDGYVQSSRVSGSSLNDSESSGRLRTAYLTLCVPADKLDDFLGQVDGTLNVTYSQVTEQDVTAEYYDLKSRMDTLNVEKQRLTEMLENSEQVGEMLEIEKRLYDIIEEYEAKQTQMNVYATSIAYSRVNLTLSEVRSLSQADTSFGERFLNAASMSWHNFGQGFLNFLIWFVSAIPTLLLIVVIVGAVVTIILSSNRRTRKKRQTMMEDQQKHRQQMTNTQSNENNTPDQQNQGSKNPG